MNVAFARIFCTSSLRAVSLLKTQTRFPAKFSLETQMIKNQMGWIHGSSLSEEHNFGLCLLAVSVAL